MVDMDAWRMDQRPQKKWEARAYLRGRQGKQGVRAQVAWPASYSSHSSPIALSPPGQPRPRPHLVPAAAWGPQHPFSPINLYQQIFLQLPLLPLGDAFTFLYLCQVMANKMELRSTDKSQAEGRLGTISQGTPFLHIPSGLPPAPPPPGQALPPAPGPRTC